MSNFLLDVPAVLGRAFEFDAAFTLEAELRLPPALLFVPFPFPLLLPLLLPLPMGLIEAMVVALLLKLELLLLVLLLLVLFLQVEANQGD